MSFNDTGLVAGVGMPREARRPGLLRARMAGPETPERDIVIRNVSQFGIGAVCDDVPPPLGQAITLFMPHGEAIAGEVRWVEGRKFGLKLAQPLDLAALQAAMLSRNGAARTGQEWVVSRYHQVVEDRKLDQSRLRRL